MFEFDGSSSTLRTPRGEQIPVLLNSGIEPRAVGDVGRAVVDEAPRRAAVRGLVEAPLGGTRNGPVTPEQQDDE